MVYVGSSFKGRNFDNDTVLGRFIKAVKDGEITPPVCLCFENWDRFGRDVEWKNNKRFYDLIAADVSLGVVSMDMVIDQDALAENPRIIQWVANDIERARKESQRKSGFGKRNLFVKVERAKGGEKIYFGGQSPRWIVGVKDGKFIMDTGMVAAIERIFDLYINPGLKDASCTRGYFQPPLPGLPKCQRTPTVAKSYGGHVSDIKMLNSVLYQKAGRPGGKLATPYFTREERRGKRGKNSIVSGR